MEKNLFLVKFRSAGQFDRFYKSIKQGQVFIPASAPVLEKSYIILKIIIPVIDHAFLISGIVSHSSKGQDKSGIRVDVSESMESVLLQIDKLLASSTGIFQKADQNSYDGDHPPLVQEEKTESETNLHDKGIKASLEADVNDVGESQDDLWASGSETGEFSFETLKNLVSQESVEIDVEKEPELPDEPVEEKKELTAEEGLRGKAIGQFVMNLTKAMLRSGYYDPEHPSADSAKKGLYNEFIRVLGNKNEIMLGNEKTRDHIDIMITGILDEPVTVRNLVGKGVADLFVPKLSEFFDRKGLFSFAIKKEITPEHFNSFTDIMSDPTVDQGGVEKAGDYLTEKLIEHGIVEISAVFVDDLLLLELNLPQRVEMAIQRLAKDLKTMPMFKKIDAESIAKLKIQNIQDIIRPLNHPRYLNDFLVNCYIIAENVDDMEAEEIENIIVSAFPFNQLLPTSHFAIKEMESLKNRKIEQPDSEVIDRRLIGIKRILKLISKRVILEKAPGANTFLAQMHQNNILPFNELPPEVQYHVNTRKIAQGIDEGLNSYIDGFINAASSEDALVYLKGFRRTIPIFIEDKKWKELLTITGGIKKAAALESVNSDFIINSIKIEKEELVKDNGYYISADLTDISELMMVYVFKDVIRHLVEAYETVDKTQRILFDGFINSLGALGVDIQCGVLTESDDREIRKLSFDSLVMKGNVARKWAVQILKNKSLAWFIHRNALMVLHQLRQKEIERGDAAKFSSQQGGQDEEDFNSVRRFLTHSDSRLRDEAIKVLVSFRPHDAESLVIAALTDEDAKVRWRATRAIAEISPISEDAIRQMLDVIKSPIPDDKQESSAHMHMLMQYFGAINAMPDIPLQKRIEEGILGKMKIIAGQEKGLKKLFKKIVGGDDESNVLKTVIPLLGRIGSSGSADFLKKLMRTHRDQQEAIKKALFRIKNQK